MVQIPGSLRARVARQPSVLTHACARASRPGEVRGCGLRGPTCDHGAARTHIRSRVEVVTVFLTMGRVVLYSIGVRTLEGCAPSFIKPYTRSSSRTHERACWCQ